MFPTVAARIFGMRTGITIFPVIFAGIALTTVVGCAFQYFIVAGKSIDKGGSAYHPVFYILSGMSGVAFLLALLFKDKPVYKVKPRDATYVPLFDDTSRFTSNCQRAADLLWSASRPPG